MRGIKSTKTALIFAALFTVAAGQITSARAQIFNIFQTNSTWRYSFADPYVCLDGTGWEQFGYDDSAWPEAPGGFTGGETSANALVGVTTMTLPAPGASGGQRASFRKHFNLSSVNGVSLILSNRIDDNAVFWVNGQEIGRFMAGNTGDPVTCGTMGGSGGEATVWQVINVPAAQLVGVLQTGDNVIAASVGQNAPGSSDMVFAMALWGEAAFPVTITDTTALSNRTVVACTTTTLTVGVNGSSPITFHWIKDGADIDPAVNPTATNQSLVLNNIALTDAGSYTVRVQNPLATVTSSPAAVITVLPDTTPPTVVSAIGQPNLTTFVVTFSEPMDANNITDTFGYQIKASDDSETLVIDDAVTQPNPSQVILTTLTTPRNQGKNYKLIVNGDGLTDYQEACNTSQTIAQNTIVPIVVLLPLVEISDTQLWRYLDDNTDPGPTWADVSFDDSAWAQAPAPFADPIAETLPVPARTDLTRGPNAGTANYPTAFFRTHFVNPGYGANSAFSILTTVDDGLILYLNGVEVFRSNVLATVTRTSYGGLSGGDVGNTFQGPFVVNVANFAPGDNVLAAILYQGDATSSDWAFGIEVNLMVTNVSTGPISFVQQPQSLTVNEGQPAAFSVAVEGGLPITYQWQKSSGGGPFGDIAGATGAGYSIPNASPADNGDYRVVATNPAGSQTSSSATLMVNPDTTRPTLISAAGSTNASEVQLVFSRPISAATGGSTANYQIVTVPGNTPLAINLATVSGSNVTLSTAPRVFGTSYRLTITGLRDTTFTGNLLNPNPTVVDPLPQDLLLLGYMTSPWRYNTNCQNGINWNAAGFDDSSWQQGLGFFGFENDAATVNGLPGGANSIQTTQQVGSTILAFYYRTSFDWPYDTSGAQFLLNHYIDDGAVFYVNGSASVVYNYTNAVPPNCTNLFSQPPGGDAVLVHTNLNGVATGHNVVAVEVHQSGTGSSDVLFGCELIARVTSFGAARPRLTIAIEPNGTDARITWAPVQGTLQFKNNLDDANWTDVSAGGTSGNVVVPVSQLRRFYSVRQ